MCPRGIWRRPLARPSCWTRGLVRDALGPARQFAQLARSSGLVGFECAVAEDADDLIRLLAIFGRRNSR